MAFENPSFGFGEPLEPFTIITDGDPTPEPPEPIPPDPGPHPVQ